MAAESNPWPGTTARRAVPGLRTGFAATAAVLDVAESPTPDRAYDAAFAGRVEPVDLYSDPAWQLANRVANSRGFAKSDLLPRLLLYVCERTLLGHAAELTEQHLGTHIFNRAPDYDPSVDNIVRSYARTLRKRLEAYFETEGRDESLCLTIPRGGYVPVFAPLQSTPLHSVQETHEIELPATLNQSTPPLSAADALTVSMTTVPASVQVVKRPDDDYPMAQSRSVRSAWVFAAVGMLVGLFVAAAVVLALRTLPLLHPKAAETSPAHALWAELFSPSRTTIIVPADSGLGILQNLTHKPATLQTYVNGSYLDQVALPPDLDRGSIDDLRHQHYTSFVDLTVASMVQHLPEASAGHPELRHTHDVTTDDLKRDNAVLIGSRHANPWVELYENRLNFRMQYSDQVDQSLIVNTHPRPGEQNTYPNGAETHAIVAFMPGLDGKGHVLLIQGLNMAGTQAAADTLANPALIGPILRKATAADGALLPFEYLLETFTVGANAPEARILAVRIQGR